ncbi:SWIM zinc finger family protein [Streptomyces sp. NPDC049916]|uniref:SWIM zinc finger family protein n=1 Tax=Streptomyces sp. NPDC049916 TaxID=3155156 RepID=UPI00341CCA5C
MQLSHGGEFSPTGAPVARWTVEQVLALASDDASRRAGTRLGTAGPWSGTGADGAGAVWGLCKGSGSTPYQTVVDTTGPAYRCSCPSRKFPCKHALGLLLLRASDEDAFREEQPDDWAAPWIEGRRARAAAKVQNAERDRDTGHGQGTGDGQGTAQGHVRDHEGESRQAQVTRQQGDCEHGDTVPPPATPRPAEAAARKRAERRAARITDGAEELEHRLADLLRGGLATADRSGYALWEETAARMVDAQAPGLAARARELGAIAGAGPGGPLRLLEECGLLHLLATAWLGRDRLPDALAATVRTRVGLPSSAEGPPVRDHWLVLAQYDTPDGRIVTRRIWLYGRESGRTALLLSFGAAGRSPAQALPVGGTIDAELTPYPGGGQLRVELGRQFGPSAPAASEAGAAPDGGVAGAAPDGDIAGAAPDGRMTRIGPASPPPGITAAAAPGVYGAALREDPWLDAWPVTLREVVPVPSRDGWQLADAGTGAALPIAPAALSRPGLWKLVAVSGGAPVTVFGEIGHRGFDPFAAWDPEGGTVYSAPGDAGTTPGADQRSGPVTGPPPTGGTASGAGAPPAGGAPRIAPSGGALVQLI